MKGILSPRVPGLTWRSALYASGALVAMAGAHQADAAALAAYNVNPASVSVSGLSSGGFMAAQLGVAYSGTFQVGFGVFAGGPYDCARNQEYTSCMYNATPSITTPDSNMASWSGNQIDSTANLKNRKIYMWVGSADTTVGPNVMNQLKTQLSTYYTAANFSYITTSGAVHTFPTNFSGSGDNSCTNSASPYISNCSYDGAGAVLQWMYGTLNSPNTGTLGGSVVSFAQTGSYGATGMDTTGYLYVPANCASGSTVCKLHVALHGCLQSYNNIGSDFINNTGYNKWADTNNIIILYPQAIPDNTSSGSWQSGSLPNPNGCWDWIGWYGANADQHGGVQMAAIVAMVNKITSGYNSGGGSAPATPTGLAVGTVTSSSIALSWSADSGATSYTVYRNGTSVGTSTTTSYTDTGLAANTTYTYTISATNSSGTSAQSSSVQGTTSSSGGSAPATPTGLAVGTVTSSTVALSWSTDSGATSYTVYRNGTSVGTATSTSYTDSGLSASTTYTYTISATNSYGTSSQSSSVQATTTALYSQTVTNTIAELYALGYLTLSQYLSLGAEYGYTYTLTLYDCSGTWTDSSTCGPMH